jgi:hypothetical protein
MYFKIIFFKLKADKDEQNKILSDKINLCMLDLVEFEDIVDQNIA